MDPSGAATKAPGHERRLVADREGPSGFSPHWSRTRAGPGGPWPPRAPGAGPERAGPERDGAERGRDEDTRPRAAHRRRHGRTIDEHPVDRHQLEDEPDSRRGP